MYGGYSPYSHGGGYGLGGYSRLSNTEEVAPSRFVQQAEESSRGAFQSIESIVQAFGSVSMMLDATFSAVYNSFRAVLDVANHLTRLRSHLTRVLSAFTLVRTLRYLYRRLQRLLGRRTDAEVDDLWADSAADALATSAPGLDGARFEGQPVKSWPILLFFAVVLGGPYLIWKLLSSATGSEETGEATIYDFACVVLNFHICIHITIILGAAPLIPGGLCTRSAALPHIAGVLCSRPQLLLTGNYIALCICIYFSANAIVQTPGNENSHLVAERQTVRSPMVTSIFLLQNLTSAGVFAFPHSASRWASGEDDHVVARAEYDFSAASEEEISLRAGDMLNLAPKGERSSIKCWMLV